jgi:hypothetical protein
MAVDLYNRGFDPGEQQRENSDHEDIAERAYTIYENRNREDGHDLEDWLQAEPEIQQDSQEKDVA